MSLKNWLAGLLLFAGTCSVFSQSKTISGKILYANDSLPLVGATVNVKGTLIGDAADVDGNFSITVNSITDTLVFNFLGMETKELPASSNISLVYLSDDAYAVEELVVTALGISRKSKSLGYSVDKIESGELVRGNDKSFLTSLQGKVAGVNISSSSGSPGSSSRIMIRGTSSLGRSNQPLFIVDGVPVSNSFSGSSSINGGIDYGNGVNDIDPENIESMSVLKGSAGTSLYGSRASNGVIIITTKNGSRSGKPTVSFSSSVTLEEPLKLVRYQNEFGQGLNGEFVSYENTSWGPAFDKEVRFWGHMVDSTYRVKPYVALPNNVKEFFDIGVTYNNSISVDGGNDRSTYFISYSNVQSDGIFPTNADEYKRNTFTLRSDQDINDKLKASVTINWVNKYNSYVATGQGGQSVYNQIMQTPRDISLLELSDLDNEFNNIDNFYSLYTINPYYILNNSGNTQEGDRVYGNINIDYELLEGLKLHGRFGEDFTYNKSQSWRSLIEPEGNNEFAAIFEPGEKSSGQSFSQIKNLDLLLTFDKEFLNLFGLNFLVGGNAYETKGTSLYTGINSLSEKGFYHLSNSNEPPYSGESSSLKRLVGLYSNLDLSYRSLLFVSISARNDWSSTLEKPYYYPGVNTGFVFSELLSSINKVLSYGKLRAGVARTGNDAPVYTAENLYVNGVVSDGYGTLGFPLSGVSARELSNLLGNGDLKSELKTEYEIGTDLRFFQNRIGFDVAYYRNEVTNLIWAAPVSSASGFTVRTQNLGEIRNEGIELLTKLSPFDFKKFNWDISLNFSTNKNKLVSLNESTDQVVLTGIGVSGGQQINYIAIPGREVGIFEAREILKDSQGRIVVDNQGLPRASEDLVDYGDGNYDYIFGINNSISFAGFTTTASVDVRQGGIMYSRTKDISGWAGTSIETIYNNRQPFIVPNSVYETGKDNEGNPIYAENNKPIDAEHIMEFWGNGGYELDGFALIDKSYIKIREVTISYELPEKLMVKMPFKSLSFNVVGKNLWLWTPEGQDYIDPEVSTFGTDLISNFGEYSATPSIRSVSFGLRIKM